MTKRFEGTFRTFDQSEIFYQTWMGASPRATVVITHGLAEHSECYNSLAQQLVNDQYDVWAWDLRGHGRSDGRRGFAGDFSYYMRDYEALLAFMQSQKDLPVQSSLRLFGHSMGGLITLRTVLEYSIPTITCLALSSPALGIKKAVPGWKSTAAELAAQWMPTLTLSNEIQWRELTKDEAHLKTYDRDPLRHDRISPAVFLGMLNSFPVVFERASQLTLPFCLQLGAHDPVTDVEKAREFFDLVGSPQKHLFVYPDSLHEIYNDTERATVYRDLKNFLARL